jgi:hypothetical protein
MKPKQIQMLVEIIFLFLAMQTVCVAEITFRPHYTNATVVANSRKIIEAIESSDDKSKASAKALVGSQVAYFGTAGYYDGGTNINIYQFISKDSNEVDDHLHIRLYVEFQSPPDIGRPVAVLFVEVSGTVKSVDFDKRIIYIQAKPEDYKEYWGR